MPKTTPLAPCFIAISAFCLLFATAAHGQLVESAKSRFIFKDADGKSDSAEIVTKYVPKKIVHPVAKTDSSIDPKLRRAATIAEERAHAHSRTQCWHYVKHALFSAGVISSYPKTAYASEAGDELIRSYGFKRLPIRDPYAAPIGAVLVYGNKNRGHVEIRTKDGFVSDFRSPTPSKRPLMGVYAKL